MNINNMIAYHIPFAYNRVNCSYNNIYLLDKLTFASFQIIEINLRYNSIDILPKTIFSTSTKLTHLDISHNRIFILNEVLFKETHSLRHLNLSFNNIYRIDGDWSHMIRLNYISLEHNKLSYLTRDVLGGFLTRNFTRILRLNSNRFQCNCNLKWLSSIEVKEHLLIANMADTCHRKGLFSSYNIRDMIMNGSRKDKILSALKIECRNIKKGNEIHILCYFSEFD